MSEIDVVAVTIYCCEPSHDGKRYIICRFVLDNAAGAPPAAWCIGDSWNEPGQPSSGKLRGARAVHQILVGDRYVTTDEQARDKTLIYSEPIRGRYQFRCDICGLSLVRHAEPVRAALDKLAAAGVSEISLAQLAAIV
jgi:hypothetical protein